jgi:hypothetical protein
MSRCAVIVSAALASCLASTPAVAQDAPPPTVAAQADESGASDALVPLIIGGVGAAAVLAGVAVVVAGSVERSSALDECAPYCNPDVADSVRTKWIAGGLTATGGTLLISLAAMTWALMQHNDDEPVVSAVVTADGAAASLTLHF